MTKPQRDDADFARRWRSQWTFPEDLIPLNHGSYGPSPRVVQEARIRWYRALESDPMDFFRHRLGPELRRVRETLGPFVGADADDLALVGNATEGMNHVADSVQLQSGDEVLLTDQEYGAVRRLWTRTCQRAGAKLVIAPLDSSGGGPDELVERLFAFANEKTRLVVASHVTSPTARIFPVEQIVAEARRRGITTCIDGAHAVAMLPLDLRKMGCDYYVATCHKWLCAPFGSGFLYVARAAQAGFSPAILSWGLPPQGFEPRWHDELSWPGTHDPSALLSIPAAIEFMTQAGLEVFRDHGHRLVELAAQRIPEVTQEPAEMAMDQYGTMVSLPLPSATDPRALQAHLWEKYRIEVVADRRQDRPYLRLSFHLYNGVDDLDGFVDALRSALRTH